MVEFAKTSVIDLYRFWFKCGAFLSVYIHWMLDSTNEDARDSVCVIGFGTIRLQDQLKGFTYNSANKHLSESMSYPSVMERIEY